MTKKPGTGDPTATEALASRGTEAEAPLVDEGSQRLFDLTVLYNTLRELRSLLANAKVNHHIATAVGIEGVHPKQFSKVMEEHRKHIELIVGLVKALEADETAVLPEPVESPITVVSSLPRQKD